jgi:SAM-dependent methyltransferase
MRHTRPLTAVPKIPSNKVGTLELYKRFPQEYDLLMGKHDCSYLSGVLGDLLSAAQPHGGGSGNVTTPPAGLRVADLGCGTGRALCMLLREAAARGISLKLLCGYDKEAAMLKVAMSNICRVALELHPPARVAALDRAESSDDTTADPSDVAISEAPPRPYDNTVHVCLRPFDFLHVRQGALASPQHPSLHMAVCAWSLSYVMRACWGGDRWHQELRETVEAMMAAVVDGGVVVIVETLGNGCETPTRRNTMLEYLEETLGFERQWVRTDYNFSSVEEGESMCRFFFAHGVADSFKAKGSSTLPECTGIWTKKITRLH